MPSLNIWVENTHAATLTEENNNFSLYYTDEWNAIGYSFSPHLPLNNLSSGASVRNFFSNLLPEGQILEGLSQAYQVSKYDVFNILRNVGKDCAGALVISDLEHTPNHEHTLTTDDYEEVSTKELNERIEQSATHNTPIMMWNTIPRMSLAGVQNKLGIYIDENNKLFLPSGSAPTSHILKPDSNNEDHPNIAANEYFCMQLAKQIGINVPYTTYMKLPTPVFLVERYDRVWNEQRRLTRTHQIDGCQGLNLPPNLKYEQEYRGGPLGARIQDLMSLASLCRVPAVAQQQIIIWVLFNYLIGNSDAHAKNISFLINQHMFDENNQIVIERGMKVAPFYDLVCGRVYDYIELAQSIGGENEIPLITRLEWKQFASDCQISFVALQSIAKSLLKRLDKTLPRALERINAEVNQPIIGRISEVINVHRGYIIESLL